MHIIFMQICLERAALHSAMHSATVGFQGLPICIYSKNFDGYLRPSILSPTETWLLWCTPTKKNKGGGTTKSGNSSRLSRANPKRGPSKQQSQLNPWKRQVSSFRALPCT